MNTGALTFDLPERVRHETQYGSELLRVFWRRKLIVMATVVVITMLAATYAYLAQPVFKATATMIVATDGAGLQGSMAATTAAQDELLITSQAALLGSRPVARQVADSLALFDDIEFNASAKAGAKPGAPTDSVAREDTVTALQGQVDVRRLGRSAIISVTAASTSADKAAHIANKFLSEHIALQRTERTSSNRAAAEQLRPQAERLRQQVIAADRAVASYRRSHNIIGSVEAPDMSQLGRLASALAEARSSGSEASARARAAAPSSGAGATSATSILLNDLRRQSAELGKRVAELSAYYGPGYPELVNAQAQLANVDRRAAEEAARVARELRTEVAIGQAREGQLSSDLNRLRGSALGEQTAAVRLLDLNREAEASRAIYVDVLARLHQVEGQAQLFRVPAKILTRASVPNDPSFPRRNEIIGVAALGSFVLGLVLAFAFEQLSGRRIRTAAQVEELLNVPTLGMIPRHVGSGELYRALIDNPASVFSEAMRSLYLEVSSLMPRLGAEVVVVTSPLPGDGKTTLALSLGAAAAVQGRRAVVVDFDLRHPGLIGIVGAAPRDADLVAFLEGSASLDDIVIADGSIRDLSVIGVNRPSADAGSLLSSPRLGELIAMLRERYDCVSINAPPLLAVRDAKTLAAHANATLLVLHWRKTHIDAVNAAARIFGRPFTGAVINHVNFGKHARAYHGDAVQHHAACSSYYFAGNAGARAS